MAVTREGKHLLRAVCAAVGVAESHIMIMFLLFGLPGANALAASRAQVKSLPGLVGAPPTPHWSGFVEVEPGTQLFYYLVKSAGVPSNDPLVWWMNGGPGASSLVGLFSENGPLLLNKSLQLTPNPYSWNKKANLLYVEFGPGVGYSFCANSSMTSGPCPQASAECSPCFASDSSVARQNALLITRLLTDKDLFPEFRGRPLFLAGESYAGVYVPTLAAELLAISASRSTATGAAAVNLQGLWVTDPCTDNAAQFGWLDLSVDFAWQKGLIDAGTYELLRDETHGCFLSRTAVGDRVRSTKTTRCKGAWRLYDMATAGIGDAVHPLPTPGICHQTLSAACLL